MQTRRSLPTNICIFVTIVTSLFSTGLLGREPVQWNRFRGPNGQGIMPDSTIPIDIGPDSNVQWKIAVPPGKSSPVIWNDRVFLTGYEPDNRKSLIALCIDRNTGDTLWTRTISVEADIYYHPTNAPASPTPAVDANHLYVHFGGYGLVCYSHAGDKVWERRIPSTRNKYGPASSVILHENKVILALDDDGGTSHLLAVHRDTGDTIWDQPRSMFASGWSTPMIWNHDGTEELVVLGSKRVTSYDPSTGEERWWASGFSPETVGVPVAGDGLLFVSTSAMAGRGDVNWDVAQTWTIIQADFDTNKDHRIQQDEAVKGFTIPIRPELPKDDPGYGLPIGNPKSLHRNIDKDKDGAITEAEWMQAVSSLASSSEPMLLAVRPGAKDDARKSHVAWQLQRGVPETPSLLYHQGILFLFRAGGLLTCLEAATGKEIFRKRLGASGHYISSPVSAGDRICIASAKGVVTIVQAADELKILSQNDFNETIEATPAISHNTLYLRTAENLYALGRQ